jgi:DNA repair protein RadC
MGSAIDLANQLKYYLPSIRLCLVQEKSKSKCLYAIKSPEDAAKLLNPLRLAAEEHFVSLHLNAKHEVIGLHEVSHGTLSASLVHPREVFKAALLANSFAIIVCHNHPSGSVITPSSEDIETTRQLLRAGKLLGIGVIDHLILGPDGSEIAYSMREKHPKLWTH